MRTAKKKKGRKWKDLVSAPAEAFTNVLVSKTEDTVTNFVTKLFSEEKPANTKNKTSKYNYKYPTSMPPKSYNPRGVSNGTAGSLYSSLFRRYLAKISDMYNFVTSLSKAQKVVFSLSLMSFFLFIFYAVQKINARLVAKRKRKFDEESIKEINHYDVCVVGGGPAGSTAAHYLSKGGLKVLLLEKKKFPHDTICGDVIRPPCFSILQEMGVLQILLQEGMAKWTSARGLKSPSGNSFVTEHSAFQDLIVQRILFDDQMILSAQRQNVQVVTANVDTISFDTSSKYWSLLCTSPSSCEENDDSSKHSDLDDDDDDDDDFNTSISITDHQNNINIITNHNPMNNNNKHSNIKQQNGYDCHNDDGDNENESQRSFRVYARFVIAADGADSKLAKLQNLIPDDDNDNDDNNEIESDHEEIGDNEELEVISFRKRGEKKKRRTKKYRTPHRTYFSRSFAKPGTHNFRADYAVFHPPQLLPGFFVITREHEDYLSLCCFLIPGGTIRPSSLPNVYDDIIQHDSHIRDALGPYVQLTPLQTAAVRVGGVKKIYKQQFLVVGGAAGHVDPLTGEGIQYAVIGGKLAAKTVLEGFACGDISERFLRRYQSRVNRWFGWDLYISSWVSHILYKFPLILDAVAAMIQRNSEELPELWLTVRSGKRNKFMLLRPDILFMLAVELVYQWFNSKYKLIVKKSSSSSSEDAQTQPSENFSSENQTPILVQQRVRRARRQSLISTLPE